MKKIFQLLLIMILLASTIMITNGATNEPSNAYVVNSIKYMSNITGTIMNSIKIDSVTPLYDINNNINAYCIDFTHKSNGQQGYIILSNIEGDEPILEYSEDSNSGIGTIKLNKTEKFVYISAGTVYKYNQETLISVFDGTEISQEAVEEFKKTYEIELTNDSTKAKKLKEMLQNSNIDVDLSNSFMLAASTNKIISGVADYGWYKGCAPTSAAMVLNYHFPTTLPTGNTLIEELAVEMSTNSSGGTSISNIPVGISNVVSNHGLYINTYNDGAGRSSSTFTEFQSEINSYNPVIVNLIGSTATSGSYPNGFGNHSMAGVGYSTYGSQYLIVHTTGREGNVYINFDSVSLGTNYWTYVK